MIIRKPNYSIFIVALLLLMGSCQEVMVLQSTIVKNKDELYVALSEAKPGDAIVMANGIWKDIQIKVSKSGEEDKPITLRAETPGKVFLQGRSNLQLGGNHIFVEGLYFSEGSSPSRSVISFAVEDTVANYCTVTNCVIKDFNKSQRNKQDLWVLFKGRHNQLDHCYLSGKSNKGPTVRVDLTGNQNINNYHKIIYNHFGPRPPKGGPSAETIQIGSSHTSMCPSYTLIENNLFEECNGEVEVISSKTNFNEFRSNVFYKSEGSLVTRHGNYCTIDGNYFIGDEERNTIGGVRLIGTGHIVTNNYFYNLRGKGFRSPLAVMNGIPKSPLNRYIQVTDVIIAYNSWVNCESPLQFGVGSNVNQKDVLPASEIRSARPRRTVVANNLIYNNLGHHTPIVAHDKTDGILFKNNLINSAGIKIDTFNGLKSVDFKIKEVTDYIALPTSMLPNENMYQGYGFDQFDKDLFGNSRIQNNTVGAIVGPPFSVPAILDNTLYGTDWHKAGTNGVASDPQTHLVTDTKSLTAAIEQAADGDNIELEAGDYFIDTSLKIDKTILIKSRNKDANVNINYRGEEQRPLFEMHPSGNLTLLNLNLSGTSTQIVFAPLKENMSSLYNLTVESCSIKKFDYILKAYKHSFSEYIRFAKTSFMNCTNGLELSEETDDRGDYNAEKIDIQECVFDGISAKVIDYYRGGYDESTVGGTLSITNSTFLNCGAKEKNGILLNTYGIINVNISDNTFKNNKVQKVALLWGAKNNHHINNVLINSGSIVTEENLKLKTFY